MFHMFFAKLTFFFQGLDMQKEMMELLTNTHLQDVLVMNVE